MKISLLIAAWKEIPTQHRVYFAGIVGAVIVGGLALGYGPQVFAALAG
ncbi:MAG: hypothetical protein IPL32_18290 [Chloracidobacterium sp.]|nr:hypothetical protein [Chloracidobacterium sp.]